MTETCIDKREKSLLWKMNSSVQDLKEEVRAQDFLALKETKHFQR
jgi:hypothetical protein